jgi:hypothetical protein
VAARRTHVHIPRHQGLTPPRTFHAALSPTNPAAPFRLYRQQFLVFQQGHTFPLFAEQFLSHTNPGCLLPWGQRGDHINLYELAVQLTLPIYMNKSNGG